MGWCHEFGSQIREGCDHPMEAGASACGCEACGVSCEGRFTGCASVWQRGPRKVTMRRRPQPVERRPRLGEPFPPESAPAPSAMAAPAANGHTIVHGDAGGLRHESTYVDAEDPGRNEVLDWLRAAFDGVRADLRALTDTVARQQSTVAGFEQAAVANHELVTVAAQLPERVAEAVAEALAAHQVAPPPATDDALVGRVSGTLAGVEAIAAELRNELVRLTAFREALAADLPAVASAVDEASARAERRLRELTDRVEDLAARPARGPRLERPAEGAGELSPRR